MKASLRLHLSLPRCAACPYDEARIKFDAQGIGAPLRRCDYDSAVPRAEVYEPVSSLHPSELHCCSDVPLIHRHEGRHLTRKACAGP